MSFTFGRMEAIFMLPISMLKLSTSANSLRLWRRSSNRKVLASTLFKRLAPRSAMMPSTGSSACKFFQHQSLQKTRNRAVPTNRNT
ncbi:hypothetical protein AKJ16_DCAP25034 [Drosera capensis]